MAGYGRLNRAFQKRRKKNGSSRSWAIKARKSPTSSSNSQVTIKKTTDVSARTELETKHSSEQRSCFPDSGILYNVAGCIMLQCQHRFSQIWSRFCNVLLFWRTFTQRVDSLQQKVEELQSELCHLRSSVLVSHGRRSCGCLCEQPNYVKVSHNHQQVSVSPPTALAAPPPPPLPPPLPPSIPQKLPLIIKKKTNSTLQEKVDRCVAVTLKDLQAVQLRKVTPNRKLRTPDGKRAPLITLADLQKVRLRRTQCSFPSPSLRPSLAKTPSTTPMRSQLQLRKAHGQRSLGSTPLHNKENKNLFVNAIMNPELEKKQVLSAFPTEILTTEA